MRRGEMGITSSQNRAPLRTGESGDKRNLVYCVKDFIKCLTRHFHHHAIHVALLLVSREVFDRWCNSVQDVENSTPHIRAGRGV